MREGVVFSTYMALVGKQAGAKGLTRLGQLVRWCCGGKKDPSDAERANFDGLVLSLFDESHTRRLLRSGEDTRS